MNDTLIIILRGIPQTIPKILILAACIYLVIKIRSTGPILMLIGESISFILSIYYNFFYYWKFRSSAMDSVLEIGRFHTIIGTIGIVAYTTFAVGLFIFVINVVKKKKALPTLHDRIENIQ